MSLIDRTLLPVESPIHTPTAPLGKACGGGATALLLATNCDNTNIARSGGKP
ncbi:MAG TPA: hypothetical protein VIC34_11945 [Croceibacterium sp.]|jgi:hypothetical protein